MGKEKPMVGKLVLKYRKMAGLTQKELGTYSGYAEITIRQIEAGKFNPSPIGLFKIAQALGVTTVDLLPNGICDDDDYDAVSMEKHTLELDFAEKTRRAADAYRNGNADEESNLQIEINGIQKKLKKIYNEENRYSKDNVQEFDSPLEYERYRIENGFQPQNNVFGRKAKLITAFDKLNEAGQNAAVDRVEELTEVPKYQKET